MLSIASLPIRLAADSMDDGSAISSSSILILSDPDDNSSSCDAAPRSLAQAITVLPSSAYCLVNSRPIPRVAPTIMTVDIFSSNKNS